MGGWSHPREGAATVKLLAGDFLPDLPKHGSAGISDAVNLYPGSGGYRPVGQWVAHTDAIPSSICRGAAAFVAPSGRVVVIAGTKTALYRQDGLTWALLDNTFLLSDTDRWRFVQFGAIAIATNSSDEMVKINLETDAVALLGGLPPKFQALAVVNNFVVGTQADGQVNKVQWSGENNAEWWTPAQRKSDFQEMPDGGEITGIVGGEIGLILQRNAVRRMAYVGGNVLFRFDKISANVGCASVHSVAQYGELAFWHSYSGFKMWDGAQIRSIGFEKVDNAFATRFGALTYEDMSTAVDGQKSTVCWSTGRRQWIYNWALDKWSTIDFPAQIITQREAAAPSLEEQDPLIGAPDDDVDSPGLESFDAGRYLGGDPSFYVFNADGALGTFSGNNMAASVTGRLLELIEGRDARLTKVRPLTNATSGVTIRIDTFQSLNDGPRRRDFTEMRPSGVMPVRSRGRYTQIKASIAANVPWDYLQGVDTPPKAGGGR
jgi:hypothetical protein